MSRIANGNGAAYGATSSTHSLTPSNSGLLPSLPGYKVNIPKTGPRQQLFETREGYKFVKELRNSSSSSSPNLIGFNPTASIASLGTSSSSKCFPSLALDSLVLNFTAIVHEPGAGSSSIKQRRCSILYHVDDDTIKIVEHPQLNVPPSTLLRRSIILKEDNTPLLLDDLQYGEDIVIYGRCYSIINCADSTRRYLESIGRTNLPPRRDLEDDDERSWSKTGPMPEWGTFRREKNNLKIFMEAKLGNTVNNTGREGFNEFGNRILKFLCVWDDTEKLYGDTQEFVLVYHLSDDTIEIFNKPGIGKEQFPKLVKRAPLLKDYGFLSSTASAGASGAGEEQYYHWSDLFIGADINVYSRLLHIIDADNETRDFYDLMECPLGGGEPSIASMTTKVSYTRTIPPHNGFGSDEDSLKSCVGPLCPSSAPTRTNVFENRILSFFAKFVPKNSNDDDRRFVISFYFQDNSVKITEPTVRNSGYVGGLFLSRRKVKKESRREGQRQEGGEVEYLKVEDFVMGGKVKILTHEFVIIGGNEFTLKWLENEKLRKDPYAAAVARSERK
jgi:EF-hand domain-containing protein 1